LGIESVRNLVKVIVEEIGGARGRLADRRPHPHRPRDGSAADGDLATPPGPRDDFASERGSQYTSWAFGHRLRQAGRHTALGYPSPIEFDDLHTAAEIAHDRHNNRGRESGSVSFSPFHSS